MVFTLETTERLFIINQNQFGFSNVFKNIDFSGTIKVQRELMIEV